MLTNRVVVTGLGAVTPIGNNVEAYWTALQQGVSGAGLITKMDVSRYKTRFACEVKGFDPFQYLDVKEAKSVDLYTQYAIAAASQAFEQAGLKGVIKDPYKAGVIFASGIGGLLTLHDEIVQYTKNEFKPRFSPHMISKMIANIAAGVIGIRFDFRGPNYGTVSACASSSHSISDAFNLIRLRKTDVFIVGGAEASINPVGLGGFSCMRAISENNENPQIASRPFDKDRDGFVLGEGAGALVLESLDHAEARNAPILAELIGCGMTADAFHATLPHPEGRSVYQAMVAALEDGGVSPDEIDYVNLHGTSTPAGDPPEIAAVQRVFHNSLDRLHVSGTKSMTGHLLGAAGAIEAVATVLSIKDGIIPPTINTCNIDPKIDLKANLTLGKAVKKPVRFALSNNFGFGGQNATLLFKKFEK